MRWALVDAKMPLEGKALFFHAATEREDFGLDVVRLLLSRGSRNLARAAASPDTTRLLTRCSRGPLWTMRGDFPEMKT